MTDPMTDPANNGQTLDGKRILLIIGGGIAAYRALELIRRLMGRGAHVRAILTEGGAQFITPLSVAALSGERVFTDLFSLTDEAEMGHIRLSREADLVVVAPATANLMARMAHGQADDLATTALLATDKPVMVCPSMNVEMWAKPATQRNITTLEADGILRVGPDAGALACGETGAGRLADVEDIVAAIDTFFGGAGRPLAGHSALVTAGPTLEAIDPVRYIANRSSGKQGYAIAAALGRLGAHTTLVSGPTALPTPDGVKRIDVESADEMLKACQNRLPVDVAVCVAAVSDWRANAQAGQKIKKDGKGNPTLELAENPDILATLSAAGNNRPRLVVGFAAETENLMEHARAKLKSKGCDWIVANDVSVSNGDGGTGVMGGVMGSDENSVHVITGDGEENWPRASKVAVADKLALCIAATITGQKIMGKAV